MDRRFQSDRYTTQKVKDRLAGYEGFELLCHTKDGQTVSVARLVYWDAAPGYFLEDFNANASVPLDLFEEFIAETLAIMRG